MKLFLLLLARYTYLIVPGKYRRDQNLLPKALRFLPLLGLLCGLCLLGVARLLLAIPLPIAAAALTAANLLLGGGLFLQDLMALVDGGRRGVFPETGETPLLPTDWQERREKAAFRFSKMAAGWGAVWLCVLYIAYLLLLRWRMIGAAPLIAAPVFSRWLLAWLVYGFPAAEPAWLHKGFSKRSFWICSGLSLLILLPLSGLTMLMSLVTALLGVYIFAGQRHFSAGGLDEACYGAGVACGELLFLLAWLLFGSIMV
ncbi:MAG: adenosylcobinamide-GDP ribazoletransferase [Firmicutes bacterium]|nr:adenosylcobinamide-GDP ribazoletransferase [Bacillota bacterium]